MAEARGQRWAEAAWCGVRSKRKSRAASRSLAGAAAAKARQARLVRGLVTAEGSSESWPAGLDLGETDPAANRRYPTPFRVPAQKPRQLLHSCEPKG